MNKFSTYHCDGYTKVTRRSFLKGSSTVLLHAAVTPLPNWMPRVTLADPHIGPRGDTLVCVFLRGGADGLNIVVPHGDDSYYAHRPSIAIARPGDRPTGEAAVDLDGFFGLHPTLQPLYDIYRAGDMAFVQATGSPDETRSHFEAMDLMERGAVDNDHSGWIARHLASLNTGNQSALRAIAVGDLLPQSLSGHLSATALRSVADYHLNIHDDEARRTRFQTILHALYTGPNAGILQMSADQTLDAINTLGKLSPNLYTPGGRPFTDTEFGQAMQTVAQLIAVDAGVEVACIDLGGWDTHVTQGGAEGIMANLLSDLGHNLAAFYEDLGPKTTNVTVMVMSEFGRRVQENGGLGTDHGHGNMMMLMGGGIHGGQVHAKWPGLDLDQLTGPGDLHITTDYRDILAEVVRKRLNNPLSPQLFPNHEVSEHGLAYPRS